MFAPKMIKTCQSFFKSQSILLGMLFLTYFCSFQLTFRWLFSPGTAEADTE